MPAHKNQHFVPKSYLRRFSADGNSIRLFNLGGAGFRDIAPIKNQCSEDYMYGKDERREVALGDLEGLGGNVLDRVLEQGSLPSRSSSEWNYILMFIGLQYGRTIYVADAVQEMVNNLLRRVGAHDETVSEFFTMGGKVEFQNAATWGMMNGLDGYLLLSDLHSALIKCAPGTEFITCDAPVVCYNQLCESFQETSVTGWTWKGLQVFFPLGPEYSLMLYDGTAYNITQGQTSSLQASTEDMRNLNLTQYVAAYKNLYFKTVERAEILRLQDRGESLRRKEKTGLSVRSQPAPGPSLGSELLISSKTDVRTGMELSFIRPDESAVRWAESFKVQPDRPLVAIRDLFLHEQYELYQAAVKEGRQRRGEFHGFASNAYRRKQAHGQARPQSAPEGGAD